MTERRLDASPKNPASNIIVDLKTSGVKDLFRLISKASSDGMSFMRSTKAMDTGEGVLVQVSTLNKGVPAEALTYVPGVRIEATGDLDAPYTLVNFNTGCVVNESLGSEAVFGGKVVKWESYSPLMDAKYMEEQAAHIHAALVHQSFIVGVRGRPHTAFLWSSTGQTIGPDIYAQAVKLYGATNMLSVSGEGDLFLSGEPVPYGTVVMMHPDCIELQPIEQYVMQNSLHYPQAAIDRVISEADMEKSTAKRLKSELGDTRAELGDTRAELEAKILRLQAQCAMAHSLLRDMYERTRETLCAGVPLTGRKLRRELRDDRNNYANILPVVPPLRSLVGTSITNLNVELYLGSDPVLRDILSGRLRFYAIRPSRHIQTARDAALAAQLIREHTNIGDIEYHRADDVVGLRVLGKVVYTGDTCIVGVIEEDEDDDVMSSNDDTAEVLASIPAGHFILDRSRSGTGPKELLLDYIGFASICD